METKRRKRWKSFSASLLNTRQWLPKTVHPPKNLGHEILLKNRSGCGSSNLGSSGMIVRASLGVTSWAFSEDLGKLSLRL